MKIKDCKYDSSATLYQFQTGVYIEQKYFSTKKSLFTNFIQDKYFPLVANGKHYYFPEFSRTGDNLSIQFHPKVSKISNLGNLREFPPDIFGSWVEWFAYRKLTNLVIFRKCSISKVTELCIKKIPNWKVIHMVTDAKTHKISFHKKVHSCHYYLAKTFLENMTFQKFKDSSPSRLVQSSQLCHSCVRPSF